MKMSSKLISVILISALGVSLALAQGGGGGGQGRGQGRGGNNFSELRLLGRKDVQKDLGLTDDQVTKITDYATANAPQRGAGGGGGAGGGAGGGGAAGGGQLTQEQIAAFAKAAADRRAKTRTDLLAIISEAQLKRVDEIGLQLQGNNAITQAEVQKALGLSDDQVAKVKDLQAKQRAASAALRQKMTDQEITREDLVAANAKNTETMKVELGKILTSAQADKLKGMMGKTFTPDPPAGK